MSPDLVIDRSAVRAFCQRHRIARLAVFGSALRDDFGPDSDVDVLVELQPVHVPGLNFVSMERELSGLRQGRPVDLVAPKFLNVRIRESCGRPIRSMSPRDLVYDGHMLDMARKAVAKPGSSARDLQRRRKPSPL
jgi:predicted nucleotidyltransferase